MRIVWVLHTPMETQMQYKKMWGYMLAKTQYRGTYKLKGGGHWVRGRAKDPGGREIPIFQRLDDRTDLQAHQWLVDEKERIKKGHLKPSTMLFADYATSLLEKKITRGDIKSQAGKEKWRHTLTHWIAGTEIGDHFIHGFGEYPVTEIKTAHIERWKDEIAPFVKKSKSDKVGYAPGTLKGWLRIMRVISKAIAREYETRDFMDGVTDFDMSDWETYSEEEPNSLKPEDVPRFLDAMMDRWPQHYAMTFLGFMTGLRPSMMRPIRWTGAHSDVLWDEGRLLVRRSETRGQTMKKTKTGIKYSIHLPKEVMEVLRWHATTQLNDAQKKSELLFPNGFGGYRAGSVLIKPFDDVGEYISLKYRVTPYAMRRTFQDLARAAEVKDIVTRSVSGQADERMQQWYSTVSAEEQRESLGRVFSVIQGGKSDGKKKAS